MQATPDQRLSVVPCTTAVEPSKLVQTTSENDVERTAHVSKIIVFVPAILMPAARRGGLIAAESAYAARNRGNATRLRWAGGASSTALRIAGTSPTRMTCDSARVQAV